jgi:hypothetical protein
VRTNLIAGVVLACLAAPAFAQSDGMSGHEEHQHQGQAKETEPAAPAHAEHAANAEMTMQHGEMAGALGDYSMMRDSSGTSWQPESTPMEGVHGALGDWSTMAHGFANLVYDHQGGPRGGDKTFSQSMLMGMAQRPLGDGTLTLRAMISFDPLMGRSGYPLLFQTGETVNGRDPLVDRQHPHDFLMELSATYSAPLGDGSGFIYVGYPGEPALGPPTFMHRFSGAENPEAPLGHHWLDATHVSFGVVTAGYVFGDWKLEASAFKGREPDENRWDFDSPRLDSGSARLTWNPDENWSLQVSWGYLRSPEQLEPEIDQRRTTASVSYNRPFSGGNWQTTFAWGHNDKSPGDATDTFLLESAVSWEPHTVFARAENVAKDELFEPPDPLAGRTFHISKLSLGYVYDLPLAEHLKLGLGALGSVYGFPDTLDSTYGDSPTSFMLFARLKLD